MTGHAFVFRIKPNEIDRTEEALDDDQLIIGWANALGLLNPLLEYEDFKRVVQTSYHPYALDERKTGQAAPHLWRFIRELLAGDLILVPKDDQFYLAEVLPGGAIYDSDKRDEDAAYRRDVKWLNDKKARSRSLLSRELEAQIRSLRQTSKDVTLFHDEIAALIDRATEGSDWTSAELEAVVIDYRDMLQAELSAIAYNKTEHRRRLMTQVTRSEGSIEFKHQNISAVLEEIGLPWIKGYKPRHNFQASLVEVVGRIIGSKDDSTPSLPGGASVSGAQTVFVAPPPPRQNGDAPRLPAVKRLARKIDQAARDQRNRDLGRLGEQLVIEVEKARLAGTLDLAERVSWVAEEHGDGLGYDIESFDDDGKVIFIEVKTTRGGIRTPFYISSAELSASADLGEAYRLFRVFDYGREPKIFVLHSPLFSGLELEPSVFRALPK